MVVSNTTESERFQFRRDRRDEMFHRTGPALRSARAGRIGGVSDNVSGRRNGRSGALAIGRRRDAISIGE
jgi:hypothetical protein